MTAGAALGDGAYFGTNAGTSFGYTHAANTLAAADPSIGPEQAQRVYEKAPPAIPPPPSDSIPNPAPNRRPARPKLNSAQVDVRHRQPRRRARGRQGLWLGVDEHQQQRRRATLAHHAAAAAAGSEVKG